MTLDVVLVAAGGLAVVVAAGLRHLVRYSVSPPLLALLTGTVLGPHALDVVAIPETEQLAVLRVAARLLLAVALMAVALRYPLSEARSRLREVTLMLVIVLPVMAGVLAAGAHLLLGLPLVLAFALGAALSPTDPVLASGIASSDLAERDIPARDRQVLSLESGANDGLAMPLVVIAVALVLARPLGGEIGRAVYEVIAGVALGAILGAIAGAAMRWAKSHREVPPPVRELYTVVVAFFVLGVGGLAQADGLLSVLVAGLVHNAIVTGHDRRVETGVTESMNHFLVLPVFLLLGIVLPWDGWGELGLAGAGFVAVAMFLRRLPIVLLLRPALRAPWAQVVWLGWFGPIGVAAVFYLGHLHHQGVTDPILWHAGTLVVAVSTVLHGVTTGAARVLYRGRAST
jgi:NhaP-type Na+/H+ or K+/H+ antiporter